MKKLICTLTLAAGLISIGANAQSAVIVRSGNAKASVEAKTGDTYHLTVGDGKAKDDVTFYSNSYASLYAIYLMLSSLI
jgi:hypothetical protein